MSVESKLKRKIQKTLADRLFKENQSAKQYSYANYVLHPEEVLVPEVEFQPIREDLEKGGGGELEDQDDRPPKFHAAHSSSALVANTFGPYRNDPKRLTVAGHSGFEKLRFEYQCDTGAGRGIANLDLLLKGDDVILGVESKLVETLSIKKASFSKKYHKVFDDEKDAAWMAVFKTLDKKTNLYDYLDATQLVKHYLGLRRKFNKNERVLIVYLYWEPLNAKTLSIYQNHADEIKDLIQRLSGTDTPLLAISYTELWNEMEASNPEHVARLRARYEFSVE